MKEARKHTALALAGGNALGAYGAGAYEAMHARGYTPDAISGASIGAITGAIIAGNVPAQRIEKLREYWRQAAVGSAFGIAPAAGRPREMYNLMHALQTLAIGRPGLFKPRVPGLASVIPGMPPDVALFDSKPLVSTLQRVVDFDRLNAATVPLVIATVDIENGEPVFFDTRRTKLEPLHFLATTAFTPGFPPVEIDGRLLADPGLISNLPLDALLDPPPAQDLLCFAVDLFDAIGIRPYSLDTGLERAQDIVFSTQALRTLEARSREHRLRHMLHELSTHIPPDRRSGRAADLAAEGRASQITAVLIAYRAAAHELSAKTVDFSRASIDERWAVGLRDMNAALDKLESGSATAAADGFTFFDGRVARAEGRNARDYSSARDRIQV
jgi:NTE family protein